MSFLFSKLSDSVSTGLPAYWTSHGNDGLSANSPSGRYVTGYSIESARAIAYLLDCSTRPPVLVWKDPLYLGAIPGWGVPLNLTAMAVDDEGSVWGKSGGNDGQIIQVPKIGHLPANSFTFTDDNGHASGLTPLFMWTVTESGGTIHVVTVPEGTVGHDNTLVYLGTKGGALTKFDTATTGQSWVVWHTFIDAHDDVWVAGAPPGNSHDTMYLWRLTNIGGTNPYSAFQTFTMPVEAQHSIGYFSGGYYVGAWVDVATHSSLLFRAHLTDSSLTTRDISAAPLSGVSEITVPTNPSHYFLWLVSNDRTLVEVKSDLSAGQTWNLDQWVAGDTSVPGVIGGDTLVKHPLYLDGQDAFCGVRSWFDPADNTIEDAEFFLYYFGSSVAPPDGAGDGVTDSDVTLRCWTYSLDGHDYYVLRVGQSATLVYDLTTGSWSEWSSPGRNNWRAHVGCNWVGMSATTINRGFGSDVVAGDDGSGVLWILDPTVGRDDRSTTGSDYFNRIVTGGLSVTGRTGMPCNAVELDLALGNPTQFGATITLETSNDFGHVWANHGAITTSASDYSQTVEWRSLGQIDAPGRVFRITDNGATVRINGADMR